MTDDLAQLLRSADGGRAHLDLDDIARRGRRLRVARVTALVAAAVVVVAGGAGIVAGFAGGPATRAPVIGEPGPSADPPSGQSQSVADAARDGVIGEVATLPFEIRVRPDQADAGRGEQRVVTEEGVWVVSRPDWNAFEPRPMIVGDETGRYGRDFISTSGYGEVLLLGVDEYTILRAFPFPDAGPQALLATEDAVYCARQGDGGLPASMLCRIDRETLEARVRVFPHDGGSHFLDPEEIALPDGWVVDDPYGQNVFGDVEIRDGRLFSVGQGGSVPVDPDTLELLDAAGSRP